MAPIQRAASIVLVLSGLLLGTAMPVRADGHDCDKRIHKAEKSLRRAVEKYGDDSHEAEFRRHELRDIREHCEHLEHHERKAEERREKHLEHEEHEQAEHGY